MTDEESKSSSSSSTGNIRGNISSSLFCSVGGEDANITDVDIQTQLHSFLRSLGCRKDVLILPPDYTRFHSQAGKITRFIHDYYSSNDENSTTATKMTILPALGTHAPMTQSQIRTMFGDTLADMEPSPFVVHDWRKDVVTIGHAPAEMVERATSGMVRDTPWPAQLNRLVWEGGHDLVLSVGQVVPHEVMGMANFNKNLFVGVGGVEAINLSHFIGAVHGMERMMGQADNPLRRILNYASEELLQSKLPLWYILTVVGTNITTGALEVKGFYIGDDITCYNLACELSLKVNFTMLETPLCCKVVVHLDEDEFHSTWLGNKAIYRTRMAIADGGELIVLAPGVRKFGEDDTVDALIRKYGYRGTPNTLRAMEDDDEMRTNLSAVAHLIHGSTEGRFSVTYCTDTTLLTKEEVEGVGYHHADLEVMRQRYSSAGNLATNNGGFKDGWNTTCDGEEFYYISNPALGLWAVRSRFEAMSNIEDGDNDDAGNDYGSVTTASSVLISQKASDHSGGVGGWKKSPPIN